MDGAFYTWKPLFSDYGRSLLPELPELVLNFVWNCTSWIRKFKSFGSFWDERNFIREAKLRFAPSFLDVKLRFLLNYFSFAFYKFFMIPVSKNRVLNWSQFFKLNIFSKKINLFGGSHFSFLNKFHLVIPRQTKNLLQSKSERITFSEMWKSLFTTRSQNLRRSGHHCHWNYVFSGW